MYNNRCPSQTTQRRQECIPVGCVQSAAVAVPGRGECLPRGKVSACQWGVSACQGCLLARDVCLPVGCLPARGVSACQGGLPAGGVSARQTSPVDRMTDTCKTLPCRNCVADGNNKNIPVSKRKFIGSMWLKTKQPPGDNQLSNLSTICLNSSTA